MKLVTQDINLTAGSSGPKTLRVSFDKGYVIKGVMFEKFTGANDIIKTEFRNSQGSLILDPLSINFLAKGNDGFKPETALPFPNGVTTVNDLRINLFFENLTADYSGEFLFILEKEKTNTELEFLKLGTSGANC